MSDDITIPEQRYVGHGREALVILLGMAEQGLKAKDKMLAELTIKNETQSDQLRQIYFEIKYHKNDHEHCITDIKKILGGEK